MNWKLDWDWIMNWRRWIVVRHLYAIGIGLRAGWRMTRAWNRWNSAPERIAAAYDTYLAEMARSKRVWMGMAGGVCIWKGRSEGPTTMPIRRYHIGIDYGESQGDGVSAGMSLPLSVVRRPDELPGTPAYALATSGEWWKVSRDGDPGDVSWMRYADGQVMTEVDAWRDFLRAHPQKS